ncbi:MAG TPA: peptidoglycan bridge formation glycyltransferase FemA/FemB family protein [Patescibacteria group bacterium]|nr:peptidoglycan bridge formation glycyltransferase FemA/FemB family protein [Patescibacteria group bacterium]
MIIREVLPEEKDQFNTVVNHPLQTWEWGEFRKKTGLEVIRLGLFDEKKIKAGYQVTVHPIPKLPYSIIYFPKGPMPDKRLIDALIKLGQKEKAILVKLEPNILTDEKNSKPEVWQNFKLKPGDPYFTKHTFYLDLTKSDEELMTAMKPKTRYNLRLSQKHVIEVAEDNSPKAFEVYLKLMAETTKRQGFYAHTPEYHQKMWETLQPTGLAHLLTADYQGKILVTWVLFKFKDVLYYPYGWSTREHQNVMASYAMMWAAIQFGKKQGCKLFDLWGTPGPDPSPQDPWFGFHRFKLGFGAKVVEFVGTYDLVIDHRFYPVFNLANALRWKLLRLRTKLPF